MVKERFGRRCPPHRGSAIAMMQSLNGGQRRPKRAQFERCFERRCPPYATALLDGRPKMEARAAAQDRRLDRAPLIIRRVDAIPVALPLLKPMKMAGVTIAHAYNLLVRIEAADGTVGWGEAASAPTMTGDTLGGLVAAVRDHLGPALID